MKRKFFIKKRTQIQKRKGPEGHDKGSLSIRLSNEVIKTVK